MLRMALIRHKLACCQKQKKQHLLTQVALVIAFYTSLSPLLQAEKVWGFFSNKVEWSPGSCFFSVVLIMRSLSLELLEIICLCSLWSVMVCFLTHSVRTSAVIWLQTSSSIFNRPYFYTFFTAVDVGSIARAHFY